MPNNNISQIPVETFSAYIVEKLRRSNPHIGLAYKEDHFVLGGAVVHIAQAGASPAVVKNRKTFPATAVQRADSSITYALNVYSTDPLHVAWHEGAEISYEKLDSILGDITATLVEAVGDNILYDWLHGFKKSGNALVADIIQPANYLLTSGASAAVNTEDGQTGTRKAAHYKDLQTAQAKMNKQKVPAEGRYTIFESYMYQQFLESLSSNQMAAFEGAADMKNGVVGRFAGFNIMERSSVLAVKADSAFYLPDEALDATANLSALCFQKDSVAEAKGDIIYFEDKASPLYYGDVVSALVKFGGRARRSGFEGVIPIVQAAG